MTTIYPKDSLGKGRIVNPSPFHLTDQKKKERKKYNPVPVPSPFQSKRGFESSLPAYLPIRLPACSHFASFIHFSPINIYIHTHTYIYIYIHTYIYFFSIFLDTQRPDAVKGNGRGMDYPPPDWKRESKI